MFSAKPIHLKEKVKKKNKRYYIVKYHLKRNLENRELGQLLDQQRGGNSNKANNVHSPIFDSVLHLILQMCCFITYKRAQFDYIYTNITFYVVAQFLNNHFDIVFNQYY